MALGIRSYFSANNGPLVFSVLFKYIFSFTTFKKIICYGVKHVPGLRGTGGVDDAILVLNCLLTQEKRPAKWLWRRETAVPDRCAVVLACPCGADALEDSGGCFESTSPRLGPM